jgi:type VI secretion system protein ImpK
MSALTVELGQRLPDLYTEMFAFVLQLSLSNDPGPADALRVQVNRLLGEVAAKASEAGYSQSAVEATRYAVVALVDELVLTSNWPCKNAWLGKPLQMEHFGSFAAGEQFFQRLDQIRGVQDAQRADVLEVYTLCLWLGFKGKYGGVQGMEQLRQLRATLIGELATAPTTPAPSQSKAVSTRDQAIGRARRKSDPKDMSPAWHPPSQALTMPSDLPVRPVLVASLALLALVYALLAGILSAGVSSVVQGS